MFQNRDYVLDVSKLTFDSRHFKLDILFQNKSLILDFST